MNRKFFSQRTALIVFAVSLCMLLWGANLALAGNLLKPTGNMSMKLEAISATPTLLSGDNKTLAAIGLPADGAGSLVLSKQGQVLVYIRLTETTDANLEALKSAGALITHVAEDFNTVTAFVAPANLGSISALDFVGNLKEVTKPMVHQADCSTATTSEGDSQLKADNARQQFSVDGSGVTVGVLSDSYAGVTTPTSADDDILTGDLPGTNNPCGRTTPVQVVQDYLTSDSTDEGRAMAQIVHDLAPGASLAFATAFGGLFGFADNIKALRNTANADIIVDDVSYFNEPIFQDGPVSVAITEVTNDGALYFTSAGNSNTLDDDGFNVSSYEASAYRGTTCPTVSYNGSTYTGMGGTCHNFNPFGTTPYMELELANGGSINTSLQWAEPWYGVTTDIDFYLTDSNYNILTGSNDTNSGSSGTQTPFENFSYKNTSGATQVVRLIISRYSGSSSPRIKYVFHRASGIVSSRFHTDTSTDTFGPSILGHSGCNEALSIAAVPYDDSTSPESFTSHGYFTVYYGPVSGTTPATMLSAPQTRRKPDVAATDGGANTFFGQYLSGAYRFYGTSAAAPHAAAVAALMREKYLSDTRYTLTQSDCETYMEDSAASIANGGAAITGAGLVDAVAAINTMTNSSSGGDDGGDSGDGGGGGGGGCFLNIH